MPEVPPFSDFYAACNGGRTPFPWQDRLARRVVECGWPQEIGIPTGLGKTACLDIAVWALASQAYTDPTERTIPTRTWYVVNRRLLVDAAYEHGLELRRWLAEPELLLEDRRDASTRDVDVLSAVAEALRLVGALGSDQGPLHVTRLRGGADLGVRVPDPSQPALVFSTVPMFASRWLFSGYGSSDSMRPIDAALAGVDSLVLLDEAHLARPLASLVAPAHQCDAGDPGSVLPKERARVRFVALTATGDETADRFELDADDLSHPIISRRLEAAKPTVVVETTKKKLARDLADNAVAILERAPEPATCVVFTNQPNTARAVWSRISDETTKQSLDADVVLLTGRMREREAAAVRQRLLDPLTGVPAGRPPKERVRHLVVVATQTLEVGANVDFEFLLTETTGVRSLIQRFGRLNRFGDFPQASAVILHPTDVTEWPVYGEEPATVWERLTRSVDDLDLAPGSISALLGPPNDLPPRTGELLPHHLWEWAKTSSSSPPTAPPELFFDSVHTDRYDVSVVWRSFVPEDGGKLLPPLHGDESVDIPIWELRQALEERGFEQVTRLRRDRTSVERVDLDALSPGDSVIFDVRDGFYDVHGWNPEAADPVVDLSLLRAGLILTDDVIRSYFDRAAGDSEHDDISDLIRRLRSEPESDDDLEAFEAAQEEAIGLIASWLADQEPPANWMDEEQQRWRLWRQSLLDRISAEGAASVEWFDDRIPLIRVRLPQSSRGSARPASDAFDELSFTPTDGPDLDTHLGAVGEAAAKIAERVGLPTDLVAAVRRAGELHDLGKLDPRFQRWLDPDRSATAPLAKSSIPPWQWRRTRIQAGWPGGGRHELISGRLAAALLPPDDPLRELIIHLVVSHHGYGRPAIPTVEDRYPPAVTTRWDGRVVSVPGDLGIPDWDQPSRFREQCERFGYWGLALLEAIVRQADHAVSAVTEVI